MITGKYKVLLLKELHPKEDVSISSTEHEKSFTERSGLCLHIVLCPPTLQNSFFPRLSGSKGTGGK